MLLAAEPSADLFLTVQFELSGPEGLDFLLGELLVLSPDFSVFA